MNCIKNISAKKLELAVDIKETILLENKIRNAQKAVRILIKNPLSSLDETFNLTEQIDRILVGLAELSINNKRKESYKLAMAKEDVWNLLEKLDAFSIKKFRISIW